MDDLTQAAREQLKTWLTSQLQPQFPELVVLQEFPSPGPLRARYTIAILATGEAEYRLHQPAVVSTVPQQGSSNGLVTYKFGYVDGAPLDLDCWAMTKPARDDLARALRRALNVPPSVSLGAPSLPRFGHAPALSLALQQLFGAVWTYRFSPVPTIDESSAAAQQGRWRAHWRGTAEGPVLDQDVIAIRKRIHLQITLDSKLHTTITRP
jgi:hypothetical protein